MMLNVVIAPIEHQDMIVMFWTSDRFVRSTVGTVVVPFRRPAPIIIRFVP